MIFYKFKTFVTSYYFPKLNKNTFFLYGLYHPYKNNGAKIYWWLFRHFLIIRTITSVSYSKLNLPYKLICQLAGNITDMSFSMGSPGTEQKISILGYDKVNRIPFFAKFSQKPDAMLLSLNEIKVLQILKNTSLSPKLLDSHITDKYVFFKTEYISGMKNDSIGLTDEIFEYLIKLSSYNLISERNAENGLILVLSHGDFCPWNMLIKDNKLRLIDWEMAKDRPLGYDLFTFIFQTSFLLSTKIPVKKILNDNSERIVQYFEQFEICDFSPYLKYFSKCKMEMEILKKNQILVLKYTELNNYIEIEFK